ncbi:hypothetical protein PF010_g17035 [Phytophthora fragariae]|uniref:Uncharacterized protein n=1 Tax=Phytophthora fragariae TaxID=53985 RepID=A0A6G0KQ75_9STRA|nr:hypothetical protein PF003_g22203 [Phytophthora fragariae]KAE9094592.1 hypothetical protein PF010_g17035 [Phytophthora fragariae]
MKPGQVHVHFVAIVPLYLSTQAPLVQSRVFSYTRFYTADDSKCSGIPQFIDIEEQTDSLDGCTPEECSATAVGNYGMVNCIPNDQEETALIYEAVNAPYVLVEVFSPDYAPCGMLSRALALHADGRCRALPTTAYSAGIAVVNADLSLEVHLYNGTECDGDALDFDVSSGDVGSACNTEYAANSFKFYASKTRSGSSMASGSSWGGNSSSQADHLSGSSISDSALSTGSSSSSMSGGVIAGVGAGCLVIVLIFAAVVFYRKKTSGRSVNSPGHSPDKDDYDGDLLASSSPSKCRKPNEKKRCI